MAMLRFRGTNKMFAGFIKGLHEYDNMSIKEFVEYWNRSKRNSKKLGRAIS